MEASGLIGPEFWESDAAVMMTAASGPRLAVPPLEASRGQVFFSTSGSTGTPKWIGHTRSSLLASAAAVNRHLQVDRSSCWGLVLPTHHVGGFGILARVHLSGCGLAVFPERWAAPVFAEWIARQGVTHLSLVPTQVHDLVAANCRAPASLKAVVVGGGVLPVATGRAARALGWPVLASYGMTETASQIATCCIELLDEEYHSSSIDLIDSWQVRLTADGRLEVSGPSLFSGMLVPGDEWKYEERSSEWFTTSDLAAISDRRLTILGRADSVVKILGELVDPVAVEYEILALCPGVIPGTAAVAVAADPRAGKKLLLLHEPGVPAEVLAAALSAYHETCPGFRRISRLAEVRQIPRSPLGKVLRAELNLFSESL